MKRRTELYYYLFSCNISIFIYSCERKKKVCSYFERNTNSKVTDFSFPMLTPAWLVPDGSPSALQVFAHCTKWYQSSLNSNCPAAFLRAHENSPSITSQLPFEELITMPPNGAFLILKVAQVPDVYHLPFEIKQPFCPLSNFQVSGCAGSSTGNLPGPPPLDPFGYQWKPSLQLPPRPNSYGTN